MAITIATVALAIIMAEIVNRRVFWFVFIQTPPKNNTARKLRAADYLQLTYASVNQN